MSLCFKPIVFLFLFLFLFFCTAANILNENIAQKIWWVTYIVDFYLLIWLMHNYKKNGPALMALIFLFTYYLAPLPYFLFEIPIVPYSDNIDYLSYLNTLNVMSGFLAALCLFSSVIKFKITDNALQLEKEFEKNKSNSALVLVYWILVVIFMLLTFRGENVSNYSGSDNYSVYIKNLENQGGSLEYFFLLMVIGYEISVRRIHKFLFFLVSIAYVYFCFTRGYRIQMVEMIIMILILKFKDMLTIKNILIISFFGFFILQAQGAMKHGVSDIDSLFSLMMGDEFRTNQTEVFYTSNNVINPILSDQIDYLSRIESLIFSVTATVIPAGFLPEIWHSTISSQRITGLPGGGGGVIAGHYFYWLSYPGLLLGAFFVIILFGVFKGTNKPYVYFLSVLLLSTFPRWMVYEPVALFFRIGVYYVLIRLIGLNLLQFAVKRNFLKVA